MQNSKAIQTKLVKAIDARVQYALSIENANQVRNLLAEKRQFESSAMLASIEALQSKYQYDFTRLSKIVAHTDAQLQSSEVSKEDFVAVYALQKVRKAIKAIASGIASFDGYTNAILSNLTRLNTLSNVDAYRSLSSGIELSEDDQQTVIKRSLECAPSTATTQASSTREMLRLLDVCNVTKRARNDAISYKDNAIAKAVYSMYARAK